MKRMITYGSIPQFRQVVAQMNRFDRPPVVHATITEKIHGTNASVSYSRPTGIWAQSKKSIITPENDNYGCARFVHENEELFRDMIEHLAEDDGVDLYRQVITLYFEWCGGKIQKNSCVSGLDRRAILFNHYKVSEAEDEIDAGGQVSNCEWKWLPSYYAEESANIYHVAGSSKTQPFASWSMTIDFNQPKRAQNELVELVERIEAKSPIGEAFGKTNIGEGVVVTFFYAGKFYRFKAKGEKHSKTKVKKLKAVDPIKEGKIVTFVNEHACPAWRLEQMWDEVFRNEGREPSIEATGDFIRAVHKDVLKEESDMLEELDLNWKDVVSAVSKTARVWFIEQLDQQAGIG